MTNINIMSHFTIIEKAVILLLRDTVWHLEYFDMDLSDDKYFLNFKIDYTVTHNLGGNRSLWLVSDKSIYISLNDGNVDVHANIDILTDNSTLIIIGTAKNFQGQEWQIKATRKISKQDLLSIKFVFDSSILNSIKIESSVSNIFKNRNVDFNSVLHLGIYHPYRSGTNTNFDDYSAKILDLKKENTDAINYFFYKLKDYFQGTFTIVTVPSHDPANTMSGIRKLAQKIASNRVGLTSDGTSCLIRKSKISKLSNGGNRSVQTQLASLDVVDLHLIQGKVVLLMDDVTTTSHSLIAGRKKLLDAGASVVQAFALAKTS